MRLHQQQHLLLLDELVRTVLVTHNVDAGRKVINVERCRTVRHRGRRAQQFATNSKELYAAVGCQSTEAHLTVVLVADSELTDGRRCTFLKRKDTAFMVFEGISKLIFCLTNIINHLFYYHKALQNLIYLCLIVIIT